MVSLETIEAKLGELRLVKKRCLIVVVRVRLRIVKDDEIVEASALANSGYEAETPQLLIPIKLAQLLNLWPPGSSVEESEFETAGGPLRVWIAPRACKVSVIVEDAKSREVLADIVISPIASEVLLSDKMISELQIALEDVGRGLWRFMWEPKEKLRRSEPPKYWK